MILCPFPIFLVLFDVGAIIIQIILVNPFGLFLVMMLLSLFFSLLVVLLVQNIWEQYWTTNQSFF
jgi:hypothetical protein